MADVIQIPTPHNELARSLFICGSDDWMLECNGCLRRMPAFEPLRGLGDEGLSVAREMAAAEGWTSQPARDLDLCPSCSRSSDGSGS